MTDRRVPPASGPAVQATDHSTGAGWSSWIDSVLEGHRGKSATQAAWGPPFSFLYGGQVSDALLDGWTVDVHSHHIDTGEGRTRIVTVWTDPKTGLRVTWEATRFYAFPAAEWVLYFENTGKADTPILQDIKALDLTVAAEGHYPWRLHRCNGAPAKPNDFEPTEITLDDAAGFEMGGGGGRSSNKDFPFFKLESRERSLLAAVGWSGQWHASFAPIPVGVDDPAAAPSVHLSAGMELTHFLLHPGEKVRSPRMLLLDWRGNTLESNNAFRQLIYRHYAARREGHAGTHPLPEPVAFCNTCFTRGGHWLNECNEQNQISLIDAYAPLGAEALITDAGWFEGGWPNGAGNWTPRRDAYPQGMAPVAAAAKRKGMVYGLWFEPERIVRGTGGTSLLTKHPEWCLANGTGSNTFLADFGRVEVQDYYFRIVKEFMDLPGFQFYRQDFNMNPLEYWRHADRPDRQGITEIRYIEGLYAYWDRIASAWPGSIREECASGGRRIDLETVMRMHLHQSSDNWFDNEGDQGRVWALSHYLPNCVFDLPISRLDDYTFRSVMPSSLVLGWIADAPGFDTARAKALLGKYDALRSLTVGSFYPLLPYSRAGSDWMAYQFHRSDLGQGMVLAFRHAESAQDSLTLSLHGLDPAEDYQVQFDTAGIMHRADGAGLMKGLKVAATAKPGSELVTYRKI